MNDVSSEAQQEEAARAELYALLAALFYQPPDAALLAALRGAATARADTGGNAFESAWAALVEAARGIEPAAIAAEYDTLFGGVGKPDVYLFGSHYLAGFLNEKPLAQLRSDLARLGLARADAVRETEDHVACLFDAMRHLVETDPLGAPSMRAQRELFERHIAAWVDALCDAVAQHPRARFYACVAELTRVFSAVERQAFEMLAAEGGLE